MLQYLETPQPAVKILNYLKRISSSQRNPFAVQPTVIEKVMSYLGTKPDFKLPK